MCEISAEDSLHRLERSGLTVFSKSKDSIFGPFSQFKDTKSEMDAIDVRHICTNVWHNSNNENFKALALKQIN